MTTTNFKAIMGAMIDAYRDGGYNNSTIIFVGKSGKEYETTYELFFTNNGEDRNTDVIVPLKWNKGESFAAIDAEDIEAIIY